MSRRKTVLITGCSDDGIGSGLALIFQQRNYHVFATARNPQKMTKLQNLPNVTLLPLDVCDKTQIAAAVQAVTEHTRGTLDYLVNNAAHAYFGPILDQSLDDARKLFETNTFGPIEITQAFAPLLIKARGTLAFITSIAGYMNIPWIGTYSASKRSLEIVADTLRLELAPFRVRVVSIVTGPVKTLGQSHFDDLTLPENSPYKPIEDKIASFAQGNDGAAREGIMAYSEKVVTEITRGKALKFWCGAGVGSAWFANTFVPTSIMVA
ncbi:hypothetical protein BDV06DRAFT_228134 [Aspergillus oleicola]